MRLRYIDDFLDFIMMFMFSGLIYGLSRCLDLFPAYHSLMGIPVSGVEVLCMLFMVLMIVVFYKEYNVLSLLLVGLSPYVIYQFILLLEDYVVFRYIFLILTVIFVLFYIALVVRYDERFNLAVMLNRYCMVMFCIIYLVTVVSMFVGNKKVETVSEFSLYDYQDVFIKFKKDNWSKLSLKDKEEALNEFVVIDLMYLLGEEDQDIDVSVKSLDSDTMGGYYSFEYDEIVINSKVLSNRDRLISVLLHECYHRYQHKVIDALDDKLDLNMKIIRDVKEWKNEIYNYVSADDSYDDYYNQSLEMCAREYSNDYTSMYIKFIDGLKEN